MPSRFLPFLFTLALLSAGAFILSTTTEFSRIEDSSPLPAAAASAAIAPAIQEIPEEPAQESKDEPETPEESAPVQETAPAAPENHSATRIESPYPFSPETPEALDAKARSAVVNIFCRSRDPQLLSSSGSGVIIDPKGVILTNAHLAQYFLLDARDDIDVSCSIRTGSPVRPAYRASVMFIPDAWVREHASDIAARKSTGTGERDFALLSIHERVDGTPLPDAFPYLPPDTREAIGFTGDTVLLAGYPAEFVSGATTVSHLSITTSFSHIGDLLTFTKDFVDVVSLGSTPLAQGGASGGAVINPWGRVIGIVTTTSEGETTAERELRAISLAHIDRTLRSSKGSGLSDILAEDPRTQAERFKTDKAPSLSETLLDALRNR